MLEILFKMFCCFYSIYNTLLSNLDHYNCYSVDYPGFNDDIEANYQSGEFEFEEIPMVKIEPVNETLYDSDRTHSDNFKYVSNISLETPIFKNTFKGINNISNIPLETPVIKRIADIEFMLKSLNDKCSIDSPKSVEIKSNDEKSNDKLNDKLNDEHENNEYLTEKIKEKIEGKKKDLTEYREKYRNKPYSKVIKPIPPPRKSRYLIEKVKHVLPEGATIISITDKITNGDGTIIVSIDNNIKYIIPILNDVVHGYVNKNYESGYNVKVFYADKVCNNLYYIYYNDTLVEMYEMIDGKINGLHKKWQEKNIYETQEYLNGVKNGKYEKYIDNKLAMVGYYNNNLKDRLWEEYDVNDTDLYSSMSRVINNTLYSSGRLIM
mgnify:FL=1